MPRFTIRVLGLLIFLAVFSNWLVNDRPLRCTVGGETYYPAFRAIVNGNSIYYGVAAIDTIEQNNSWWRLSPDHAWMAPVPYNATQRHTARLKPGSLEPGRPGRFRHWLGTDGHGHDVLAGTILGTRTALLTGLWTTLVVFLVGGTLGALAGYFGNSRYRLKRGQLLTLLLSLFPAFFYGFIARWYALTHQAGMSKWLISLGITMGILAGAYALGSVLSKVKGLDRRVQIPLDMIIMRIAEVFDAMPKFITLVTIAAVIPDHGLFTIMALVGFMYWPETARFVRAELLRVRSLDYIEAARLLRFSEWRVLFRHALPNAIQPVLLTASLAISSAVLLEASLSFLNISSTDTTVITWGKMMHNASEYLEDWWAFLPPGILITLLVAALYEAARSQQKEK